MPIRIIQQDITRLSCDVIVNPTDERFSGSGGVDRAVHEAAGRRLRKACDGLAPLAVGEVCFTKGYRLNCKYVIHTVGPRWQGGDRNEEALLSGCYARALALCERLGAQSAAFPLISSGTFGFPKDRVLRIALDAVSAYLLRAPRDLDVALCVPDRSAYMLAEADELKAFLAEREPSYQSSLFEEDDDPRSLYNAAPRFARYNSECCDDDSDDDLFAEFEPRCYSEPVYDREERFDRPSGYAAAKPSGSLEEWLKRQDDTFAVTLLKLIDKKGMTDVDCYKRSNVSRKTFSKINTQKDYRPSKQTVLAFSVGLRLTIDETQALLRTAGFSLSPSYTGDRIVEYFIRSGNYDIFEINAALYQYDQVPLGN